MTAANDNPADIAVFNPFAGDDTSSGEGLDLFDKLEDAFQINEFLANLSGSYPEMQSSPLWQEILTLSGSRYSDLADQCVARGCAQ